MTASVRARVVSVPVWLWLAGLVVASAAARLALGHQIVAPWIMVDELVYSNLAKSFAASGHFQVRGVASNGYGFVYPVLLAPAWRLFSSVPQAYGAAKAINAVTMSLAVIPAYLLARRVTTVRASLAAAALAVLIPSMLYTGTLMTENAFYPLFLTVCLVLVATLERPTPGRQIGLLALCGLAYATRQQAVALVPAVLVAPLVHGWIERDVRRRVRSFAVLYGIVGLAAVVVLGGTVARGRSPLSLLGAYRAATSVPYSLSSVLHYILWHVAELDLYVGVIPFAALLALWFAPRAATPSGRAFAAATLPVTVFLVVEVAAFASTQSGRIEERNMFYVAPFALIALFVRMPRVVPAFAAAAIAAGVLPVAIPFDRFVSTEAVSDTFALLPWWWVQDRGITFEDLRWVALGAGLVAALAFFVVPRRFAMGFAVLVGAYFVLTGAVVQNGRHGIRDASVGKLWAGIRAAHPDWIDRTVGRSADVTVVTTGALKIEAVWENEFFNRSVRQFVHVGDAFTGGLPDERVHVLANGALAGADGRAVTASYALVPAAIDVAGKTVASDPSIGDLLVRVDGPLVELTKVTGLYANDTWSGRRVIYTHRRCTSGFVSVVLQSDASLYSSDQTVTARQGDKVVGQIRIAPDAAPQRLVVPLQPHAGGTCTASFTVAKVRVPAVVEPGSADTRKLGVHFLRFDYLP